MAATLSRVEIEAGGIEPAQDFNRLSNRIRRGEDEVKQAAD
jgi:hypothetical protein